MTRPSDPSMASAALRTLGALVAAGAVLVYLAQQLTIAPNHVDEPLVLDLVRLVSEGKRLHVDFIDAYGPLHHVGPALAWFLSGGQTWAVRLWLLAVKLVIVVLTVLLVRALANRWTAGLSLAWVTALVGLPWQAMQVPFAFFHVAPWLLGAYGLLIVRPLSRPEHDIVLAGLCTAVALLIKVNSGAFLFAGGLWWTAYWLPAEPHAPRARSNRAIRWLQRAGLVALGAVLLYFVRKKVDALFYLYFEAPLFLLLFWTARHVSAEARERRPTDHHVRLTLVYTATTFSATGAYLLATLGVAGSIDYLAEMTALLSVLKYSHPFVQVGAPGFYSGFNEYYWMQTSWVVTALFVLWLYLQRGGRGSALFGDAWRDRRAVATGLFGLNALGGFVLYQVGLETHVVGAILASGPALFVLGRDVQRLLARAAGPRWMTLPAAALTAATVLWILPITYVPSFEALSWPAGDWTTRRGRDPADSHFRHLSFRPTRHPGYRRDADAELDRRYDRATNAAAQLVDELTADGEKVLSLSPNMLVAFHGFAGDIGGRYRFLFYLVRTGLIDRRGFDRIVPPNVVDRILGSLPRVAITERGDLPPLLREFPELQRAGRHYRIVGEFDEILVLERSNEAP